MKKTLFVFVVLGLITESAVCAQTSSRVEIGATNHLMVSDYGLMNQFHYRAGWRFAEGWAFRLEYGTGKSAIQNYHQVQSALAGITMITRTRWEPMKLYSTIGGGILWDINEDESYQRKGLFSVEAEPRWYVTPHVFCGVSLRASVAKDIKMGSFMGLSLGLCL